MRHTYRLFTRSVGEIVDAVCRDDVVKFSRVELERAGAELSENVGVARAPYHVASTSLRGERQGRAWVAEAGGCANGNVTVKRVPLPSSLVTSIEP
jgi:hypothetical protein